MSDLQLDGSKVYRTIHDQVLMKSWHPWWNNAYVTL